MAPSIPYGEPSCATAGDTWLWRRRAWSDYPIADGWALSYAIVPRSSVSQVPLAWDAGWVTNDGSEYTVTIPAAATATLVAGGWELVGYLTLAGRRDTVLPRQVLLVQPNLATAAAGSDVFHAEIMLGLVEAELKARLSGTAGSAHDSYQIGGRAINKMSVKELRQYRAALKAEVAMKRGGGQLGRTVEIAFTAPRGSRSQVWE